MRLGDQRLAAHRAARGAEVGDDREQPEDEEQHEREEERDQLVPRDRRREGADRGVGEADQQQAEQAREASSTAPGRRTGTARR